MKRRDFKIEKLLTPRGINVLVDSPAGHVHHHGIMYAMDVDGVTFWTKAGKFGRQLQKSSDSTSYDSETSNGHTNCSAWFSGMIDWVAPGAEKPCIRERRTVSTASRSGGPRVVTWQSGQGLERSRDRNIFGAWKTASEKRNLNSSR